jgi:site-specific recombinase XerD
MFQFRIKIKEIILCVRDSIISLSYLNSATPLREAFERAGIEGASTHSFRRTARSRAMSNAGIPLRIIQEISGHSNLEQLQREERGEAGSSQRSVSESFHAFLQGEILWFPALPFSDKSE